MGGDGPIPAPRCRAPRGRHDTAAAVISLSNGLSTAAGMGGRFTADLNAMVARLTAMIPRCNRATTDRAGSPPRWRSWPSAQPAAVALTGVGAAADPHGRAAASAARRRQPCNPASVDQIRARVEAEIEALRRGGLERSSARGATVPRRDRVNQLREQSHPGPPDAAGGAGRYG